MSTQPSSVEASRIPAIDIPTSPNTVNVYVIDTTTRINMPTGTMFDPPIKGHTKLSSPSYSFLIEHESLERKVLFDMGAPKNWHTVPELVEEFKESRWDIQVEKDVAEILEEHGVLANDIDAMIWSHPHWDHLGDPSSFPNSTDIVVGPGFSEDYWSDGEPESDDPIRNHKVREISLTEFNLDLSGFLALDYFGDGSFFLLNAPGHSAGHICALARTTRNPDTFIFMGADISNHPGEFRPTKYLPIPSEISPNPLDMTSSTSCPGHIFEQSHREKRGDSPFYRIGTWPDGDCCAVDLEAAVDSHKKLQLFDGQMDQIFVILAHDEKIGEVIDLFPKKANRWKDLGWADRVRWMFLGDFKEAVVR